MRRQNQKDYFQKLFRRKKSSEVPKLVFTYQKEEDGFTSDTDTYDGHADHYNNHQPSLAIDNFLDKSDCLSVRSFKNSNLDVQNLMDKMETVNYCAFKSISLVLQIAQFCQGKHNDESRKGNRRNKTREEATVLGFSNNDFIYKLCNIYHHGW